MSIIERQCEINQGRIPGNDSVILFGRNPDIDPQSEPEDIISQGGLYQGFSAVLAEIIDIVSDNVADVAAGTGAQDVVIFGLNINYQPISERVALNGQNIVKTTKEYLRVNSFCVDNVGSGERNAGVITATQTTSTLVMSSMSVGAGVAHQAVYTVPDTKAIEPEELNVYLNDASGTTAVMSVEVREPGKTWKQFFIAGLSQGGGGNHLDIKVTKIIRAKSDLLIRILEVSSNDSDVSARFAFNLIDEDVVKFPVIPA